jgi:hypothetical protein
MPRYVNEDADIDTRNRGLGIFYHAELGSVPNDLQLKSPLNVDENPIDR